MWHFNSRHFSIACLKRWTQPQQQRKQFKVYTRREQQVIWPTSQTTGIHIKVVKWTRTNSSRKNLTKQRSRQGRSSRIKKCNLWHGRRKKTRYFIDRLLYMFMLTTSIRMWRNDAVKRWIQYDVREIIRRNRNVKRNTFIWITCVWR